MAARAAASGRRTLVISTDPAPSLGDAFGKPLGPAPRPIPLPASRETRQGRGTLHAVEVDAPRALDRWLADRRAALERVALRGTWLDQEDVARLLRLSLPGIDEIAALLEILRFGASGRFDFIVVDTAPTGHTLRMLGMPETLMAVARLFDRMQAKHRVMVEALRGAWRPDADDELIDGMTREGSDAAAMLRNPSVVTMSWVTLPEPMAVEETIDAAAALDAQDILLSDVIVNRLTPPPPERCSWCEARRTFEADAVTQLREAIATSAPAATLHLVDGRDTEPTGVRALAAIGAALDSPPGRPRKALRRKAGRKPVVATLDGRAGRKTAAMSRASLVASSSAELILFGGKGGVGKTTCAAAAAIAAARRNPKQRVLLISADPAHSLGDVLGVPVDDTPRAVTGAPPNLLAREMDATKGFARVRERYARSIDALFDMLSRSAAVEATQDRRVMQDLIHLAPPGIDELTAVIEVVDMLDRGEADAAATLVIIDTAPSGHALRLLEMPALVQDWAKALMSILLKYQPVLGVGDLGAVLLKVSQGLGRLRAMLTDADRTAFVVVSRAAELPRAETVRLSERLSGLGIHVPHVIVNAVGAGHCGRCRRQRRAQQRQIARLRRAAASRNAGARMLIAPAIMPPPHGAAALDTWGRSWRAD